MKTQQAYLSLGQMALNCLMSQREYKLVNQKRNSLLVSLVQPKRLRNTSQIAELDDIPKKQRRKSFQEGKSCQKLLRLNCLYPINNCLYHISQKPKIDNRIVLRKAVKRASVILSTVKYWKDRSQLKIEVPTMFKSMHQRNSYASERNAITNRSTKRNDQHPVLLNQFRIRNNEKLIQYSLDKTAKKAKSASHHLPNYNLLSYSSRYSIQNVHIRIKQ
ncbi:unnamed protein product [Paramecium octaurelia]|uniref:Uncharacterized protein n=1 Tax=Paramecium octaurelia TaxID=43137 RepID=A0A8S1YCM5_PAROT|nr:unnamed protein product [Paramecium octaurelia]